MIYLETCVTFGESITKMSTLEIHGTQPRTHKTRFGNLTREGF
jgi:hypothetical protein